MTRTLLVVVGLVGCSPPCSDGEICAIAGVGELGFDGDGPALEQKLASPTSVGVDLDGVPFVVDYSNMRVRSIIDGELVTTVGNGIHAYSEIGVDPLETPLENPVDASWGPDDTFYVLPQHEGRLIRLDEHNRTELCVGTGMLGDHGDGGDALEAEMGYGGGFALASDGRIFVADQGFSRVRRVTPHGVIDTVIGIGTGGSGPAGYGPETPLRSPERITLDEASNTLFVADGGNHRVLAVDLDTLQARLVAGTTERGYSGDGGPADQAALNRPTGVLVAPSGALLIADLGNDVLRRVDPDGTITTVAGDPTEEKARRRDAPEDMRIDAPAGMAWTHEGDLLIAERGGHRVLRWVGAADAL